MPNRRAVVVRGRGPRRATDWLSSADTTVRDSLAASTAVLDSAFTAAQINALGPLTVVRTRGYIWVSSDQVGAIEEPFGALGFMVVREQARIAGIAAVPTPIAEEPDDGFFVHQFFQGAMIQSAAGMAAPGWSTYMFDSKAQRKVSPDDAIVITVENASASHGLFYILKFRMLVKLS